MIKRFELVFTFCLLPLDIVMIISSFILAYYFRSHLETSVGFANIGLIEYLRYAFYLLPIWLGIFALNGLYAIKNKSGLLADFYNIFTSSSVAVLFLIVLLFFSKISFFSRIILVLTWAISIVLIALGRIILKSIRRSLLHKGIGRIRLLIIGSNNTASDLVLEIESKSLAYYDVVGYLSNNFGSIEGQSKLGNLSQIDEVLSNKNIDEVILAEQDISREKMSQIIQACDNRKISFKYIPDTYSLMSLSFRPGLIGTMPMMELKPIPLDGWGRIFKRILDLVFSVILILILSPLILVIAFVVKLSSKGPVLYKHTRVGRDEQQFDFYKFRSMYTEKCDWNETGVWTTAKDEETRITRFGKLLRKTNLDELPQLWNILKGDISFVGPRPELPKLVEKFESQIPEYFRRHRVKTGLTGWAQVNGLKGDTSIEERVRYDIFYIENWSLLLDFKILIKTIWLVAFEVIKGKYEYSSRS